MTLTKWPEEATTAKQPVPGRVAISIRMLCNGGWVWLYLVAAICQELASH